MIFDGFSMVFWGFLWVFCQFCYGFLGNVPWILLGVSACSSVGFSVVFMGILWFSTGFYRLSRVFSPSAGWWFYFAF